jgi:hypothetical protein
MIYRLPGFLMSCVIWLLPHPLFPDTSPLIKLDRATHGKTEEKRQLVAGGRGGGGGGRGANSYNGEKAWSSISHPILNLYVEG